MENKIVEFPKKLMLEVTNVCNNRCSFCASQVSTRKRGMIDTEFAKRVIKEAYGLGTREICMHSMGEPLLHKDLAMLTEFAKGVGYEYIYMDTNGILATPDVINPVIDAGIDSLKFSINAASAEVYKKINGTDNFIKVFDNFKRVSEYINSKNKKVKLIAYMAESIINEQEHNDFIEIFSKYASDVWINPIHNSSGVMTDTNKEIAINNKLAENRCSMDPFNRMVITWEGKAIGCCTDWNEGLVYADINVEGLEESWNNDKIQKIRNEINKVVNDKTINDKAKNEINLTCRKCLFS